MKKRALKLISVVCTLALIISLCPCFSVSAATVLGDLTAEGLAVSATAGNQSPNCIVADLTLPADVEWQSSNEAVIANDGKVTRPAVKDAAVTLTGTQEGVTKTFNYVVKARTADIIFQDSFASYPLGAGTGKSEAWLWWEDYNDAYKWGFSVKDAASSCAEADAEGNQYAYFDHRIAGAKAYDNDITIESDDVIVVEFDSKVLAESDCMDIRVYLNGTDASAAAVTRAVTLARYQGTALDASGASVKLATNSYGADGIFATNVTEYNHFKFRIDFSNHTFTVNDSATAFTFASQNSATTGDTYQSIDYIGFCNVANSYPGQSNVDNFVVYREIDASEVLATLTADEQVEYVVEELENVLPANGAALNGETVIPLETYGGLVNWKNYVWENGALVEKVCSSSVTLSQNDTTFNAGRLVATITPTGDGDTTQKTYTYPYAVAPAGLSVRDGDNSGKKVAYSFDGDWTAPQTMNNVQTNIGVAVYGTTGEAVPEDVAWSAELDSATELANKSAKFVNNSNTFKTVTLADGSASMWDTRMQFGADFKADGAFTFRIQDQTAYCVEIPFNNGKFTIEERDTDLVKDKDGNFPSTTTEYNMSDFGVEFGKWNRIEIDLSTVGAVYDLYLNGKKVNDAPLNFNTISDREGSYYLAYTLRYVHFEAPKGKTIQLDNMTVAQTALHDSNAIVEGTYRRIVRNFLTDKELYAGETLYNDLKDTGALPGNPHEGDGRFSYSPTITWTMDGQALSEVDGRSVLGATNGIGTHTLKATITSGSVSKDYTFDVTVSPVSMKVLMAGIPEVKMASDISGKLVVVNYADANKTQIADVNVYNYTNGVAENEFDLTADAVKENSRLFFISDALVPLAYSVAK